jgi:PAS fold
MRRREARRSARRAGEAYLEPDEEAWHKHRATLEAHLPFRDCELARPTPDGGKRYVSVSGLPVFDDTGRFMGFAGSDGKSPTASARSRLSGKAQAYLAEAQRLTRTGSWAYNPATGKLMYWSDEAFRIAGLDPGRGSLSDPEELLRLVHPEDREGLADAIAGAVRGRTDVADDFRIVRPDGMVRHLHALGHPVLDKARNLAKYFDTVVDNQGVLTAPWSRSSRGSIHRGPIDRCCRKPSLWADALRFP